MRRPAVQAHMSLAAHYAPMVRQLYANYALTLYVKYTPANVQWDCGHAAWNK